MRVTILNGNANAQNEAFENNLRRLADALTTDRHQVTTLTLREMEIKQCVGCWGCWVKTPGECVIADDSHQVCRAVINADFVLFASPMVMGFPSALLKRTMDRLIPLVHPYIIVDQGEAHHLARYENYPRAGLMLEKSDGADEQDIQITSEVFSRTALNLKTQLAFTKLTTDSVEAVTQAIANAGHHSSRPPSEPSIVVPNLKRSAGLVPSKLTVLNGSPRGKTGNTQILLEHLIQGFEANAGCSHEMLHLTRVREVERLRQAFVEAEYVLLGFPLYTDAMPGLVKAFIEMLQPLCGRAGNPAIGFLVQSGFPEAAHSRYIEKYLEKLALRLGCPYVGTLVKGGAEGVRFTPPGTSPPLFDTLRQLGEALGKTGQFDSTLVRKLAKPERFPRVLAPAFKLMLKTKAATSYWDNQLEENGAYENRFAQPYIDRVRSLGGKMPKSIIVIGAGIAGVSAGCYGQMNGYKTQIFELHDKPGGLCTSWKRKGFVFDGCIHWLVGSKTGSNFNRIWQELGAVQGRQMVDHDEFVRVEGKNGKTFILYTNIDRLEQHLKELAPADGKPIDEFCGAARRFVRFGSAMGTSTEQSGPLGRIRTMLSMLPLMPSLMKYSRMPIQEFAARFSDPFLRESFATIFDMPDFPALGMIMTLAWMHNRDAGYPIGGSLAFSQTIERRYLDLGGEIHYNSRVEKILVERDKAVGVRLADGTEHRADVVISAADGHATIFDMLEEKYIDDTVRGYYEELPIFAPIIQVSMGVARDLSDEPQMVLCPLEKPITIAGEVRERIGWRHFCYDPTLAPPGKSVIVTSFASNHAYWKELHQDRERYEAEKKDIGIKVIAQLEKRYPGISDQVEAVDVATPMTFERYTGNWQGSMEGWLLTTKTMRFAAGRGMDKTLPGLDNFYMAGQWVEPGGGVPTAAMSARQAVQMICQRDNKRFEAQIP